MTAYSDYEELSRYMKDGSENGVITDCYKCSLAHQLLPESERTKPEEVRVRTIRWKSVLKFH